MSIKTTTAFYKIKALNKRFRIIRGSMSASKTYSILTLLLIKALTEDEVIITIVTSTYPLLKDGVITDMSNIMASAGLSFDELYNKSDKDLRFSNGSIIQFRNLDAIDTHKGKGSRRDYLFCNESNRLNYATLDPMIVRTDKAVYFDYNPDAEHFIEEKYLKGNRDDVDFITLTYKDNELIPEGELQTILDRIEISEQPDAPESIKNWVRIFAYGELGTYSDRLIYSFKFAEIPDTAKRLPSGMDFGVSPDPTILIDCYLEGANIYLDEVFCMNNLMPEKIQGAERMAIVDKMDEIEYPKGQMIIADSAGRVSILDLRKHEYNAIAVKKYPGSVLDGIKKMRAYNIHITKRSTNIKKGLESWFWKVDKSGNIIPEPDGHEPDSLAAARYVIMSIQNV